MHENIKSLLNYLTQLAIPVEEFGCYAAISQEGDLYYCPILADGTAERNEDFPECYDFVEVTTPEPEFLRQVNKVLGTSFSEKQFGSRYPQPG